MNSRRSKYLFFGIIIGIVGLSIQGTTSYVSEHHFVAYIIQDGKQLPIDQHICMVKKAPFDIVIEMQDRNGVFVNGSFNAQTYHQSIRNVRSDKLLGFGDEAIYDLWKNPLNELMIEGNRPNYWFIDSPSKHRFSSYEKVNGNYVCYRTVKQFYDLESHTTIPISKVSKSLYLTFIKFETEGDNYRSAELMRHGFQIIWE